MKKLPSFLLFLAIIVVVAACAAGVCVALYSRWQEPVPENAHDWVHSQLAMTEEQEAALVPIERRYREQRERLEHEMQLANDALADAILADGRESERVHDAIEQIHLHMGDLQKVTIAHVFEMREVLSPEQYDRLLKLTAGALRNIDAASEHGDHE
ncbi:MAG: periplasmic heavy metal sensor [Chthoniobacterales bacterium]